ncbi:Casein kinase II subunit beta [[Candida] zeylanoides]
MSSDPEEDYVSWIQTFCESFGHDYFVPVSQDFIEDDFNLTGLSSQVPYYREALYTILDYEVETSEDQPTLSATTTTTTTTTTTANNCVQTVTTSNSGQPQTKAATGATNGAAGGSRELPNKVLLARSAELLYGLIHARYVISKPGLTAMATKFERNEFGPCPRYYCDGMHLIPVGATDIPGHETVRLYCPCCNDIYLPSSSRYLNIDGAFFGTTFPGLLVKMFPEIENQCRIRTQRFNSQEFGIKLFGFKINELSTSGPRMKWLRMYPQTDAEKEEYENCELGLPDDGLDSGASDMDVGDDADDDDKTMASERE